MDTSLNNTVSVEAGQTFSTIFRLDLDADKWVVTGTSTTSDGIVFNPNDSTAGPVIYNPLDGTYLPNTPQVPSPYIPWAPSPWSPTTVPTEPITVFPEIPTFPSDARDERIRQLEERLRRIEEQRDGQRAAAPEPAQPLPEPSFEDDSEIDATRFRRLEPVEPKK